MVPKYMQKTRAVSRPHTFRRSHKWWSISGGILTRAPRNITARIPAFSERSIARNRPRYRARRGVLVFFGRTSTPRSESSGGSFSFSPTTLRFVGIVFVVEPYDALRQAVLIEPRLKMQDCRKHELIEAAADKGPLLWVVVGWGPILIRGKAIDAPQVVRSSWSLWRYLFFP